MSNLDFAKESLLYIAMLFVTTGGTILSQGDKVLGAIFWLIAAVLVVVRLYLKKQGFDK